MTRRTTTRIPWLLLALLLLACPLAAQQAPSAPAPAPPPPEPEGDEPGPPDPELQHAMQVYFHNQLRQQLALSDEQMERIEPRIAVLERARAEARQERAATQRELRRGLREGATDDELQSLLDRLERIEDEQRDAERRALGEVDALLTVRQRVEFRFFTQRFRQELQRRVQLLTPAPPAPGERPGPPDGAPPRPAPPPDRR